MSHITLPPENFNQLVEARHGPMLYNVHDTYIGRSLQEYGEWCEFEVDIFKQVVRPGDIVLDIGANIGSHTLPLARAVGSAGCVVAFEPQRVVFQALCANLALNSLTNVKAVHAGVSDVNDAILVPHLDYTQENNFGGLVLEDDYTSGEEVELFTIDSLNLPSCRLIKIDVELMEEKVLRGAARTLQELQPILYVENNPGDKRESLISFIDSIDYKMYWHVTPYFNPDNFKRNAVNIFPPNLCSHNMICVHKALSPNMSGFPEVTVPSPSVT